MVPTGRAGQPATNLAVEPFLDFVPVWRGCRQGWLRKLMVAGLSVLAASGLAGCAHTNAKTNAADDAFLASVHDSAPDISTYRTDGQLELLGGAACDGFRSGASFEQLADRLSLLEGSNALPPSDLGTVISAAQQYLCPQYQGHVGQ